MKEYFLHQKSIKKKKYLQTINKIKTVFIENRCKYNFYNLKLKIQVFLYT